MSKVLAHTVELDLIEPLPEWLDVAAPFTLVVALATNSGCDLAGAVYEVLQGESVVATGILPAIKRFDPDSNDYDPREGPVEKRDTTRITLNAPSDIGAFEWTLVLPEQEIGGVAHARASLAIAFTTGEHTTSMAVWDVPSPVVAGQSFSLKVGAKCSACCALTGRMVELRDETGAVIATGALGEAHWPGTDGLHWTEIKAIASAEHGLRTCTVAFAASDLALPHQGATASVSYVATEEGRHNVSIAIIERESGAPIADAQVRLGFHRGATDETGVAHFLAPSGEQRLFIWKAGFEAPEQIIAVNDDLELTVEALALPSEDPYARWQG